MRYIIIISTFLIINACSSSNSNEAETDPADHAHEMEGVEQEIVGGEERDSQRGQYDLDDIPCKNNGKINLDNFYQFNDTDIARYDQEDMYRSNILFLKADFHRRVSHCMGMDSYNLGDIQQHCFEFFQAASGEYRQEVRDDLMPEISKQMMIVQEPLIRLAIKTLIPNPKNEQYNGYGYQSIYDFYKLEFRKLYFAYKLLSKYSSWEKELRAYAVVANRISVNSEGELNYANNAQELMKYLSTYEHPEWAYMGDVEMDYGSHFDQYCSFWMRRGLDGSYDELLQLQEKILMKYDADWYQKLNKKLQAYPKITFEENRIVNTFPTSKFIRFEKGNIPDSIATMAENGFMLKFDNGKSKIYSASDYNSYTLEGFMSSNNYYLITSNSEYSTSMLVSKKDGSSINFEGTVSSFELSPDGSLFFAGMVTEIGDYTGIYKFTDTGFDKIFISKFIRHSKMDWVSNSEIRMETPYGGNVFIDLSPISAEKDS